MIVNLEYCLGKMNESSNEGIINPNVEVLAVNYLREKEDILKFISSYNSFFQKVIKKEIDAKKKTHATKLVKKGYSIEKVAEFFVHDYLLFTLGHISNSQALDAWYSTLPTMGNDYKDMYNP